MTDFRTSSEKNIANMKKLIEGFWASIQAEKKYLSSPHSDIKNDNVELNSSISKKLTKSENDLAAENKNVDDLAKQT